MSPRFCVIAGKCPTSGPQQAPGEAPTPSKLVGDGSRLSQQQGPGTGELKFYCQAS